MEHVLTRAVGATAELEPHVFETAVENGDVILLCSDGVSTPERPTRKFAPMRGATASPAPSSLTYAAPMPIPTKPNVERLNGT